MGSGGLQHVSHYYYYLNKHKIHFNFKPGWKFPAFSVLLRQLRLTWRSPSSAAPASTFPAMDASNSTRSPRTEWAGFLNSLSFDGLLLQHHQLGCAAVNTTFTFDALSESSGYCCRMRGSNEPRILNNDKNKTKNNDSLNVVNVVM